jgi:hypothetical protein
MPLCLLSPSSCTSEQQMTSSGVSECCELCLPQWFHRTEPSNLLHLNSARVVYVVTHSCMLCSTSCLGTQEIHNYMEAVHSMFFVSCRVFALFAVILFLQNGHALKIHCIFDAVFCRVFHDFSESMPCFFAVNFLGPYSCCACWFIDFFLCVYSVLYVPILTCINKMS